MIGGVKRFQLQQLTRSRCVLRSLLRWPSAQGVGLPQLVELHRRASERMLIPSWDGCCPLHTLDTCKFKHGHIEEH